MIDMTYDPEADAVYIYLSRAKVDRTEEAGPFIYDLDADGRVRGIEILSASECSRRATGKCTPARRVKSDAAGSPF